MFSSKIIDFIDAFMPFHPHINNPHNIFILIVRVGVRIIVITMVYWFKTVKTKLIKFELNNNNY